VVALRCTGKGFEWQHREVVNRTIAIAPEPLACTGDVETQKDSKQQRTTKQAGHDAYGKSAQTIRGFRYAFFYPRIRFCNAGVFCDRSAFRDWSYEAVTAAGQGLNEALALRRITQGFAKPRHRAVKHLVELEVGVGSQN